MLQKKLLIVNFKHKFKFLFQKMLIYNMIYLLSAFGIFLTR